MDDVAQKAERQAQILAEVAELGLTLARDLHARALAAETGQEAQALALAFHRITRSLRQTLALQAKLDREGRLAEHEAAKAARSEKATRIYERRSQVETAMERLLWTEAEGDEAKADDLHEDLNERLDEAALADDFLDIPLEVLVARLAADMGLPPPTFGAPAVPAAPTLSDGPSSLDTT